MSASVPDSPTLLQAAADYLESELLPTLQGYHRFQTRVTANVLRLLAREQALAPAQRQAELQRLQQLTGREGSHDELNRLLANAILVGDVTLTDPQLLQHLRQTLREALHIHNPGWAQDDPAGTVPHLRSPS